MWLIETAWFAHRAFWQVMMSGVFERFPKLKFVLTEQGCSWLRRACCACSTASTCRWPVGRIGELKFDADNRLPRPPSEYFKQNVCVGVSFPGVAEAKGMKKLGLENMMWGSDYPHHEGSTPYSRELLRMGFSDWSAADLQQVLARTAAKVYGFDLDQLAPIAANGRPDGRRAAGAARPNGPRARRAPASTARRSELRTRQLEAHRVLAAERGADADARQIGEHLARVAADVREVRGVTLE